MKIINHYLLGVLCLLAVFSSEKTIGQASSQKDIVSKSITNTALWDKALKDVKTQSNLFILDHGVEFNIPENFTADDVPVSLITKSDLSGIESAPYFLFHTLEIEEQKAHVRLYLVYKDDNEEKTIPQELNFIKTNSEWLLADSSF